MDIRMIFAISRNLGRTELNERWQQADLGGEILELKGIGDTNMGRLR